MRPTLALPVLALIAGAEPGWAAQRPPAALYQQWLGADEDCRGGTDSKAVEVACAYRNTIDDKMTVAGWCYGGTPMDWRKCKASR